ncbi:type II toxin-antitoxin system death-on-curing family toxin [Salinibacter altiplanensis]|uniref:type II toxin-antitoxin system death-on-curing family toxin n=1 Tax=Salinibacter altiplanensis TaxID=1803181 RepID=UPI000C9F37D1|nr:type II toxin-antitoxin system death-on-curing family toxin [Salinibacter altiplanensis]
MDDPRWLPRKVVDAIHDDQLNQHGGLPGVRDEGAVESALARNHGYRDGNKRTAFMAMYVFLRLNGQQIDAEEAVAVVVDLMKAVTQGNCDEGELSDWLDAHTVPIEAS